MWGGGEAERGKKGGEGRQRERERGKEGGEGGRGGELGVMGKFSTLTASCEAHPESVSAITFPSDCNSDRQISQCEYMLGEGKRMTFKEHNTDLITLSQPFAQHIPSELHSRAHTVFDC